MKKQLMSLLVLGVATTGFAADMPQRKPGLWEILTEIPAHGQKIPPVRQCIDEKTDAMLQKQSFQGGGPSRPDCSSPSITKAGAAWVVDSVCKIEGSKVSSHSVVSGDFSSRYTVESRARFTPPMMGMSESNSKMSARWLGPCSTGMKPGDIEVAGHRINALQMHGAAGRATPKK